MRILALDLGDVWVGSALSDPSGTIASPHQTVKLIDLSSFLETCFANYTITVVVVGLPTTMKGTQSQQTKKVIAMTDTLKQQFPSVTWALWDERLTSQQAERLSTSHSAQEKQRSHSRAAAFILQSYLDRQQFLKS